MLLYELPMVLAALWGAWCAFSKRTPFTDLVLWWTFSSIALYAIANEKVPWLLVHQILPMCLLAGYGLAQLEWRGAARKTALILSLFISAVFLLRHVWATNLENAANRHEPMLFAQTTEAYRDTLFEALKSTAIESNREVWIAGSEQWPAAWYLRDNSPLLSGSRASWMEKAPDESTLRVVLCSPESWSGLRSAGRFRSWNYKICDRYVWPRPSWRALTPQRFAAFWWSRQASQANGVLAEDSNLEGVIAWQNR
jgi:predicted membrane-bound mannosyltransferase